MPWLRQRSWGPCSKRRPLVVFYTHTEYVWHRTTVAVPIKGSVVPVQGQGVTVVVSVPFWSIVTRMTGVTWRRLWIRFLGFLLTSRDPIWRLPPFRALSSQVVRPLIPSKSSWPVAACSTSRTPPPTKATYKPLFWAPVQAECQWIIDGSVLRGESQRAGEEIGGSSDVSMTRTV